MTDTIPALQVPTVPPVPSSWTNGTHGPSQPAQTWPILDPAALHGLAGEVVATLDPHTEADPAAVLVSFLAGYGCAQHLAPHALADGAKHPPRLFAIIVGRTSKARKGTSQRQNERILQPASGGCRVLNGLSSGEGLIAAVSDGTTDKDGNLVGAVADKRLQVVEPEFARVLSAATRDGNTLSALLRQAFDTSDLRSMTKVPLVATGVHLSLTGHITEEELRAKLTETDRANGFGNRFLFVCARRSKLLPEGGNLDDAALDPVIKQVRLALEAGRRRARIRRSAAGVERWADLYSQMADDDPGGLLGAVIARAEAHTLRLSLIFALLDRSDYIDVAHIDAAWAVWQYCRASAAHVFGDTLGDEVADRLLGALRDAGDEGLDRQAQRDVFGRHVSAARLALARAELERRGLVATVTEETGGRPRAVTRTICASAESAESAGRPPGRGVTAPNALTAHVADDEEGGV